MEEQAIKKMVWEGKIPVCFRLAEDVDMTFGEDKDPPEPCYVSKFGIPRGSSERWHAVMWTFLFLFFLYLVYSY